MTFRLRHGNIARAATGAIVNAWNRNFIPHWLLLPQGVAGSLKKAAGSQPFREVSRKGTLDLGEAVPTTAGELDTDYIIHTAALHWYWSSSPQAVELAAKNVFECAESLGVDSLAIPLLGAGTGGVDPQTSLELIVDAWQQSDQRIPTEVWIYSQELKRRIESTVALP